MSLGALWRISSPLRTDPIGPLPPPETPAKKFFKVFFSKKGLHYFDRCGNIQKLSGEFTSDRGFPGVAKFGIALEWGSRGPEFESQHSDQTMIIRTTLSKWVV